MKSAFLYVRENCGACAVAVRELRKLLIKLDIVPVDNPLTELGVQILYADRQVHTPLLVIQGKGIYEFKVFAPLKLRKIKSL